jgi:hypothetical protein
LGITDYAGNSKIWIKVGIQEVRLPNQGSHEKGNHIFYYRNGNKDHSFGNGFLV